MKATSAILLLLTLTLGPVRALRAETATPPAKPEVEEKPATQVIPPDINGYKTVIAPPTQTKPVKAVIFLDKGTTKSAVDTVGGWIKGIPGSTVKIVSGEELGTIDLKPYDIVVFCGGSGSSQAKSIGEAGRNNVREFVRGGGGYLGICAGAYLACSNFSWSLGIINASTVSSQWRRGRGFVDVEVTDAGKKVFGDVAGTFKVRYANGPIIKPGDLTDLPPYKPLWTYRSELAENGTPAGVMIDSPAYATSTFGKGRVFFASPHAENTPGLENVIPRAVLWACGIGEL